MYLMIRGMKVNCYPLLLSDISLSCTLYVLLAIFFESIVIKRQKRFADAEYSLKWSLSTKGDDLNEIFEG